MITNKAFKINNLGHLEIGGIDWCWNLPKRIRHSAVCLGRAINKDVAKDMLRRKEYPDSLICFASKALSVKAIYKIIQSENLGADVVSGGEPVHTRRRRSFDMDKVYFSRLHKKLRGACYGCLQIGRSLHRGYDNWDEFRLLSRVSRENNNAKINCRSSKSGRCRRRTPTLYTEPHCPIQKIPGF